MKKTRTVAAFGIVVLLVLSATACRDKKDPAAELAAKAQALWEKESYEEAGAVYAKILEDYPASPAAKDALPKEKLCRAKALFLDARSLARAGRNDDAGAKLSEAILLAPDDVEINYGVGWVYMQLALENMTRAAMTTGPNQLDFAFLAKAHAELAKARFDRCVKLNPKHWGGHRGLGLYYMFNGDSAKALAALSEAEKYSVKPEDKVAVLRLRFQAYAGDRKLDEAKKVLDAMLKQYPDRGDVYMSLAEYHLRSDKPDVAEAIKALEVGVTKQFDDPGNRNQMYLMLSRLRLSNKDADGAMTAAEAALADDPFNEAVTDQYTVCYEAKIAMGAKK